MKTVERLTELLNSKITWCNEKEKYCKFHLMGERCFSSVFHRNLTQQNACDNIIEKEDIIDESLR